LIKDKVRSIAELTAKAMGCEAIVDIQEVYPPTINHKKETEHVIRIAEANFGKDKVKT
jgi:metal-dependent amidase/aminoacylase/carboxypeptidase family protein